MKKALSVLLVAAALFGFYGSAVTVNDLLACKDYWEEAGEKSTADMNKLEDGLNQLLENEQAYLDGQDQIADAEVQLAEGEAKLAKGEADYAAAPGKLAKGKADLAAGWAAYNKGSKDLAAGQKEFKESQAKQNALKENIGLLKAGFNKWEETYNDIQDFKQVDTLSGFFDESGSAVAPPDSVMQAAATPFLALLTQEEAASISADYSNLLDVITTAATRYGTEAYIQNMTAAGILQQAGVTDPADLPEPYKTAYNDAIDAATEATDNMQAVQEKGKSLGALVKIKGVADGKKELARNINLLADELKKNEDAVKALGGEAAVAQLLQAINYGSDAVFDGTCNMLFQKADELIKSNDAKLAAAKKQIEDGKKELAAGLKKLRKGEADYAQGLKDYAAAPGQLEEGRQQLADGYKQYEDGKNQLAQYEDGEQQIRDGLATLFNTEADLELESIANRLNGDGDFDNGDNHLEIDEGLNAVEVGRGYQAEDGVLITNEIMGRAVATGGLLAAAVLAVLAAILSFLNKNKGAGVFAILAAVAGAFGAFYGPAQGTYFSEIAGSTIGATTWVAAGVLGAVALVHAIAHFAAKKAA